jgi:hypothetical protein
MEKSRPKEKSRNKPFLRESFILGNPDLVEDHSNEPISV